METFVVRIWTPADGEVSAHALATLNGVVEHVRTARSTPFSGKDELVRLLHAGVRAGDRSLPERRTT